MTNSYKQALRKLTSMTLYYSGASSFSRILGFKQGFRILCYHGINLNPTNHYAVNIIDFALQMEYLLHSDIEIVSIDELLKNEKESTPISNGRIAISFDDGYLDFYQYAFPILNEYKIPATVFLPTGFLDQKITSDNRSCLPQSQFLTWDQVREMYQYGINFGSHSISHRSLSTMDKLQISRELSLSKQRMETEIGAEINGFAFPYGTYRDIPADAEKLLEDNGFSWAVTSISGINKSSTNRALLRRIVIYAEDGLRDFHRLLYGSLDSWFIPQKIGNYLKKMSIKGNTE